jgi:hypothetical protein
VARTAPITVKIADMPEIEAAIRDGITQAMAAERRRILALIRASCACQSCKDDIAALLAEPDEPAA